MKIFPTHGPLGLREKPDELLALFFEPELRRSLIEVGVCLVRVQTPLLQIRNQVPANAHLVFPFQHLPYGIRLYGDGSLVPRVFNRQPPVDAAKRLSLGGESVCPSESVPKVIDEPAKRNGNGSLKKRAVRD